MGGCLLILAIAGPPGGNPRDPGLAAMTKEMAHMRTVNNFRLMC